MSGEQKYILAFHKIFKTNLNKHFTAIYEKYGSFQEAWFNLNFPATLGITEKQYEKFLFSRKSIEPQQLEEEYYQRGVQVLTRLDKKYPQSLLQISDIPCILYYCGHLSLLAQKALAIVGSRRATAYGLKQARLMAAELSQNELVIVSGLARGIDGAAHRGALDSGGGTIAVLGSGLDRPYPRENIKLFQEIREKGLVLSEYPLDTEPVGFNFPIRNRIISGLSQGVFVVEARARSGSLITCDLALAQGKDVFALPGAVTSPESIGTLRLIQEGAKLVIYPQDILVELGYEYQDVMGGKQKEIVEGITQRDKTIFDLISWEPVNIDYLLARNVQKREEILLTLLELELKGLIKQLPGKYYVRV